MLSTPSDAFRKLDTDGNNLLTFEEWAVTNSNSFASMDEDGDLKLSEAEFAASESARQSSPSSSRRAPCSC